MHITYRETNIIFFFTFAWRRLILCMMLMYDKFFYNKSLFFSSPATSWIGEKSLAHIIIVITTQLYCILHLFIWKSKKNFVTYKSHWFAEGPKKKKNMYLCVYQTNNTEKLVSPTGIEPATVVRAFRPSIIAVRSFFYTLRKKVPLQ